MTAHQLLTLTAGLPLRANLRALYGTERDDIHRGVLRERLHRQPGTAVEYTDRASLIMGLVVEHLYDAALDTICTETVWAPLGMSQTTFGPLPLSLIDQVAPTESSAPEWRQRWRRLACWTPGSRRTGDCSTPELMT